MKTVTRIFAIVLVLGLVFGFLPAESAKAGTSVNIVTPGSPDWGFLDDGITGGIWNAGFEKGPGVTPPLGIGSATIELNNAEAGAFLATQKYQGVRLVDITALRFSTYTNLSPAAMTFQINYDPDVTTVEATTWYGRLIYEPYMTGSVANNTWQTWDMRASGAKWWASPNENSLVDNACGQDNPCTIEALLAAYPNIGIRNDSWSLIGFKAGSNWNGFAGNIDNFVITTGGNTDIYDFEPLTVAYVDDSWSAVTIGTDPDGTGPAMKYGFDSFDSITEAVEAVIPGGEIIVADGTYNATTEGAVPDQQGLINIYDQVTIIAADDGNTIRPVVDASGVDGVFKIHANTLSGGEIVIDGFEITGDKPSGVAITAMYCSGEPPTNLIIRNNVFHGMIAGINTWGSTSWCPVGTDYKIWGIEITNNEFYDLGYAGVQEGVGILLEGLSSSSETGGLYASLIEGNVFRDIASGASNPGGGIALELPGAATPGPANARIVDNSFASTLGFGILLNTSDMADTDIANNRFASSIVGVMNWAASGIVDSSPNWWGLVSGPTSAQYLGSVSYIPWCTNEACTTFGAPVVNITQDTYFVTIQEAIDDTLTVDGDVIEVTAGTHAAPTLIDKSVTILGPNAAINPNTGTRVAEAILQGTTTPPALSQKVEIDAENVAIRGFTFDNLRIDNYYDRTGVTTPRISGAVIKNNIFSNVYGTAVFLKDEVDAITFDSGPVRIENNKILSPMSAGAIDYNAGTGILLYGTYGSTISGNVITNAAYNGIQLARNKDITVSGNSATNSVQPALQIAQWNDGTNTISGNTFSTTSTSKAAVRMYGFTNSYYPLFNFTSNTIQDSRYGIQIGHGDPGKGYNDIRDADYSFTSNTFTNLGSYRLVIYLATAATEAEMTEMDGLFSQTYPAGSVAKAITTADPFTYVAAPMTVWVDDGFTSTVCGGHICGFDAFPTIQGGIDAVAAGGMVNVYPGAYNETASGRYLFDGSGPYQFGLFFDDAKPGIIVQAVKADGTAISNYENVVATVVTNATNSFGYSGVFVEADNITIVGLEFLNNVPSDNKTIEVIGDNVAIKYNIFSIADQGGSVYLNDWRYDDTLDVSHIEKYTIQGNHFKYNTSVDISSGVGVTGAVTDRNIIGNVFDAEYLTGEVGEWATISFNGSCPSVGWFVYPVGGATITGNTFSNGEQYIRTRCISDTTAAGFNWASYWNDNTYDVKVISGTNPPMNVTYFDYTTSGGTLFTDVQRIGGMSIQDAVDSADPGDTVLVGPGTYTEQVIITKNITLQGAGKTTTTIQAFPSMPVCFTTSKDHRPVVCVKDNAIATIDGFTIDGLGLGGSNVNFEGVAFRNAGGTLQNSLIKDIRETPFSGNQHGVAVYSYNDDAIARTIHVLDNEIIGFQKNAMALNASDTNPLTVDVQRNIITGAGSTAITAQNGIQVDAAAGGGLVKDNVITGITYDGSDWVATSILIFNSQDLDTIGNTITGAHMGIYYSGASGLIDDNTLSIIEGAGYAYGIYTDGGDAEISNNTLTFQVTPFTGSLGIGVGAGWDNNGVSANVHDNVVTGFDWGIDLTQCSSSCGTGVFTDISVVNNTLYGNTNAMYVGGPVTISPYIYHNKLSDGTNFAIYSGLTSILNAEANWWGSMFGPDTDMYVGDVDFIKWCGDSACTFLLPDEGGIIEIGPGTITETIVINQPNLTIRVLDGTTIAPASGACFEVNASYTKIYAATKLGATCIPGVGQNGVNVTAGLTDVRIKNIEFTGATAADGIHFAGAITGLNILDNWFHNLGGDAVEFTAAPVAPINIQGNLFQNNTGLGINASTFAVPAEFNSWGNADGAVAGDGKSTNVDADPWTHVDLYLGASGVPGSYTYTVRGNLVNVMGASFTLQYPAGLTPSTPVNLSSLEAPMGADMFVVDTTARTITFNGTANTAVTGDAMPIYSVQFTGSASGMLDLLEATDEFSMAPTTLTAPSTNIYAAALIDGALVTNAFTVTGTFSMQGRDVYNGIPGTLTGTGIYGPYQATSIDAMVNNLVFTGVAQGTYIFTTNQPRYLNIPASLAKSVDVTTNRILAALELKGGNAVWTDNEINILDASRVGMNYKKSTFVADADVNFDGVVNIYDLTLVGINYNLTSEVAYGSWVPVP